MLKWLAPLAGFSFAAQAIVMEPVYHAAEALGYEVAGEVEFPRHSVAPKAEHVRENLEEIRELCPRTSMLRPSVSKETHFVILAWSDQEFPDEARKLKPSETALADQRAAAVAQALRRGLGGLVTFDLVNMATRDPHKVRTTARAQISETTYDIKTALKIAGAAPSGRLELGLFGEYAQHSKAVVWVDCSEDFRRAPTRPGEARSLVQSWGKSLKTRGNFERKSPPPVPSWNLAASG